MPGFVEEIMLVVRRGRGQDLSDLDIVTKKAIIAVASGKDHIGKSIKRNRKAIEALGNSYLSDRVVIGVVDRTNNSRLLRRGPGGEPFDLNRFVTNNPQELIQYLQGL